MTVLLAGAAAAAGFASRYNKIPQHTSALTGQDWVDELLNGHSGRFYNQLGMHRHVFHKLLDTLRSLTGFDDTKYVSAEEQLMIFLHFARHAKSNRALMERFQRSGDTISKCASDLIFGPSLMCCVRAIHKVLNAVTSPPVYHAYIQLPDNTSPIPEDIRDSKIFWPYFRDCIGAIDGTHILAYVSEEDRPAYRNRKNQVSQNVLAASSIDLRFLYVLPGWEGSASDSRVYEDARTTDFTVPRGRYYLADAGYGGCDALLVPYRGVRYHIKEWGKRKFLPRNAEELFNLRHAKLRNVIERIFGVLKKRFKVLTIAQEYELDTQALIVSALSVLHNFIRTHDPDDLVEEEDENHGARHQERNPHEADLQRNITAEERDRATARRDRIAAAMWADYVRGGRRRR
jgi:hypothetical protein